MFRHLSTQEIESGLRQVLDSPKDDGSLLGIVTRPESGERFDLYSSEISGAYGVKGDHWSKGCWKSLSDGSPDPNVQISIMNSRFIDLIATCRENWAASGNNLFIDMDLSPDNLRPGQQISIGSAELEISPVPHTGCASFIRRYGRDACVFVNTGVGRDLKLRGIYARVIKDGRVTLGDRVQKLK